MKQGLYLICGILFCVFFHSRCGRFRDRCHIGTNRPVRCDVNAIPDLNTAKTPFCGRRQDVGATSSSTCAAAPDAPGNDKRFPIYGKFRYYLSDIPMRIWGIIMLLNKLLGHFMGYKGLWINVCCNIVHIPHGCDQVKGCQLAN